MIKKILFFVLIYNLGFSQVVINEVDSDTPGSDVKEFVELKSSTANFSLDGYILVFFNYGNSNKCYQSFDLDGLVTDVNGLVTIGNNAVSPVPNRYMPDGTIQNGPDGIGLYLGNSSNFVNGTTVATTTNLVDAMVHKTNDADPTSLMTALGINTTKVGDESANGNPSTESIQRKADGTYETKLPTPSANNDGTGVVQNSILITVSPNGAVTEPNAFTIIFSTHDPVVNTDLSFNYSLANGAFDSADYTADLSVLIPVGSSSVSKNITLTDDSVNEGDETMIITLGTIPSNYTRTNDNVTVRVHDNDNLVQPWGTPINPTYGQCANTKPANYYASLEGKSGTVLKQAIQDIIANPSVVREHTYGDAMDILKDSDSNPENSSEVWLMYVEQPRSKLDFQTGSSGAVGFWNREHIYPQSRGGFSDATSSVADGIAIYTSTNADKIASGHSDMHHIRAEDSPENSNRSNRNYGVDYNGPSGSAGSWHGDVARAVFYMAVRYNALNVVNGDVSQTPTGYIGDLATLLNWNTADPADDFEMNRNNVIYTWQQNRNPFIDYPDLANYIWGSNAGQVWHAPLSRNEYNELVVQIYPNPAKNEITINGLTEEATIELFSVTGIKIAEQKYNPNSILPLNLPTGIYLLKISTENKSVSKKIIIQ
jgi:hypothetical protein